MSQSAIDQKTNNECAHVKADDIAQMANDLFETMLGMPFDSSTREPFDPAANAIQSSIEIKGDWNAEFRVVAPFELASQIACAMFAMDGEEVSLDEINDAMGEIVNMIGGNAKGIADADCQLSLPVATNYQERQGVPTLSTTFECMSHPITIELMNQN